MASAPVNCKPKMWKRYVDDVLEILKKGTERELTDYLNTIDTTDSIKFTHEVEENGAMPFLDTLLLKNEDGTVKLLIYKRETHTDQYLSFNSHHPLHQKLGVFRTLMDRCNAVVTDESDRQQQIQHIKQALARCNYPDCIFTKVEH
ncbi:hypothetical protein Bbelb_381880 [Branchiostoma belcheri]|nr:hypothetical protein Bbelb_381880 [Branchiostoma belcheri]